MTPFYLNPHRHTFYLSNSSDMSDIGEFTLMSDRQLQVVLNRSGQFTARVSYNDPLAQFLEVGITCIRVTVNYQSGPVSIWSGPIQSMQYDNASQSISIQCIGWFDVLKHRLIRDKGTKTITITNPGFESGETGWSFYLFGGGTTLGTHAIATGAGEFHTGTQSEKLTVGVGQAIGMNTGALPNLPTGASQKIVLTWWMRLTATSRAMLDNEVWVGFTSAPDGGGQAVFPLGADVTTTWKQFTATFDTTSGGSLIDIHMFSISPSGTLQVEFDDFAMTYEPLSFDNVDIGEIALSLVDYVNDKSPSYITRGTADASWSRTVRYTPFMNVADEIQRMSDVENGYDFEVDPDTRQLNIFYPFKGNDYTSAPLPDDALVGASRIYRFQDTNTGTSTEENAGASMTHAQAMTTHVASLCGFDPSDFAKSVALTTGQTLGVPSATGSIDVSKAWTLVTQFKIASFANLTTMQIVSWNGTSGGVYMNSSGLLTFTDHALSPLTIGTVVAGQRYFLALSWNPASNLLSIVATSVVSSYDPGGLSYSWAIPFAAGQFPNVLFKPTLTSGSSTVTIDEYVEWKDLALSRTQMIAIYRSLFARSTFSNPEAPRFGYGERGRKNLANVTKVVDMGNQSNWIVTQGRGSTTGGGALAHDDVSIAAYGARDEVAQLSSIDSLQILAAYSNGEIALRSVPQVVYTMVPMAARYVNTAFVSNTDDKIPEPFVDYNVGDVVSLDALVNVYDNDPSSPTFGTVLFSPIDIDEQPMRIFGISGVWDAESNLKVTLQTTPAS